MASIQSLGIGSGLLTSELVEDIIGAEREATDLRIESKKAEFEAKISAFGALRSSLDKLISSSGGLSDSDTFLLNAVSSNNPEAVTATASPEAIPGQHTVEVLATARAHTLTSIRFESVDDVVGTGTIDVRFGTTTFSGGSYDSFVENSERASGQIVIDDTNNTLTGLRDAINNAAIGVNANVVDDGQGYLLVLTSDRTGEDHSMELTVTEGATAGLSALSFNATDNTPGTHLTQTVDADDAMAIIDGTTITRETNVVENVVEGVTFDLLGNNTGAPATVSVSQDTTAIDEKMQAFIEAFNELRTLTNELTDFDEDEQAGALLTGDSTIRTLLSRMRGFLSGSVDNVESSAIRALIDIGISTNQNADYTLELNSAKFSQALTQTPQDVVAMLADQVRASDAQIRVIGFQDSTQAGEYDINISAAARQASITGAAVAGLSGPITIDDDNDELSITVNGVGSGTIVLDQGSYDDGAALALEIETQINNSTLGAANARVEVRYNDTTNELTLSTAKYGTAATLEITSVDTNTETSLGFAVATQVVGQDVQGTINGVEGTGIGQFLSIPSDPEPATPGIYTATAISAFDTPPLTIDADNDTFKVSVDGVTSADIALTQGDYATGADLAAEIQSQINADATLSGAFKSVSVIWDVGDQRFEIRSGSTGPNSSVNIVSAESGVASDLGLSVGVGQPGKIAASRADAAAGFQVQVQGETIGARGTVTLVRGVMNELHTFLKQFVGGEGTLTNRLNGLDERIAELDQEASEFNDRMDLLEDRLRIQFAAADALISTLNSTSEFLDQQLSTLPGYTRDDS